MRMLLAGCLLLGCARAADAPYCSDGQAAVDGPAVTPTWEGDVQPILASRCVRCHQDDGPAPMPLTTHTALLDHVEEVQHALATGLMPPWGAAPCCNEFRDSLEMPPSERATLLAWIAAGAPAGAGSSAAIPPTPPPGLSRVDATVEMPEPFTPTLEAGTEERRCFLLDWPVEGTRYVTGIDVVPGERSSVHHVIVFYAPPDRLEDFEGLGGEDGRPGWWCKAARLSPREGNLQVPLPSLGGWTPGSQPLEFPPGLGREVEAGGKVVLQVHYTVDNGGLPDRTRVNFRLEEQVESVVKGQILFDPKWTVGKRAFVVPAGATGVQYSVTLPVRTLDGPRKPLFYWAANVHMHEWGARGRITLVRANGDEECLLEMPRWDMEHMRDYWFTHPRELRAGDHLRVECEFDNVDGNQPVERGTPRPTADLHWGVDGEMCAGGVYFAGPSRE